jgi:hypothetical protein
VAGLLFGVYLLTMPPSLTWAHYGDDGGDLVTAVALRRLPHPPGFPTYLLLGRLFLAIPWGDPAWRMNLMSALLGAGACGLTALATARLLRSGPRFPAAVWPASVGAGLSLGLAPLFWSQALIAETYAPAAFFVALVLLLGVGSGPVWLLGLVWGLGMGVHPTLGFLVPSIVAMAWGQGRRLVEIGLAAALGLGIAYGPLLLAFGVTPSPWGSVDALQGWWSFATAELYRGYVLGLPLAAWPRRLLAWAGTLARQFTPVGAALAGWGWLGWRAERSALAWGTVVSVGLCSLYVIGYDTTDSLVYLVPVLPLAAVWLGGGLAWAASQLGPGWRRLAVLLLPLAQLVLLWGAVDVSDDDAAMAWADAVLEEAPPEALLVTETDAHTFTLWYATQVLDARPDVAVIDQDLWWYPSYRRLVTDSMGLPDLQEDTSVAAAVRQLERPAVWIGAAD